MNNNIAKNQELELIEIDEEVLIIFIISLIVSLLLNYNNKLRITNRKPIWTHEEAKSIAIINSVVVVVATLVELFLVLSDVELMLEHNGTTKQIEISGIEIFIGISAVILSIMELYVVMNADDI